MGTRFMNTVESPAHASAKELCTSSRVYDTVYTDRVDGLDARYLDARGSRSIMRRRLNPLSALLRSRSIARMLGLPWLKLTAGIVASGYRKSTQMARMAIGFEAFKSGTVSGDVEHGVLPLGQCSGLVEDTPTVAELIPRIVAEAEASALRIRGAAAPTEV